MTAVSEIGVSRTAITEPIVESAREPEHVATGRDVDAGDEHALVVGELALERRPDRVHRAEDRRVVGGARRLGARRVAGG